ncbi:MAG TPA: DUF6340 family protein [Bacteroidales bacterium]|nr:DUF6340 family protein [Bacteroidales bacterium]HPI68163.1 DUF6340 family protein [Bacteroidales bacterium]
MKRVFYLLLVIALTVSCKTNELYISVIDPAPVALSKDIAKPGVIDRSMPTDETKGLDRLERIITLEGADLDKEGAGECIKGFADELVNNGRFNDVRLLNDIDFRTPRKGNFPEPLRWDIIDMICRENNVDAIFSLEYYDTDAVINYSTQKVDLKTAIGIMVPALEHLANMETIVKTGWRIYDPLNRVIADEYSHVESVVYSGRGINPEVAAGGLIKRKDAVKEVSYVAGHEYAFRLLPVSLRVERDYFVKGSNNFKVARRKAILGNWDEAGLLWEEETDNPKRKVAGRACYNMGIINEINGDLHSALEWARKAYADYNIKLALRYSEILESRIYKQRILHQQQQ